MSTCPLLLEPFRSHISSVSLCTSDQTLFKQQCGTWNSDATGILASEICVKRPADRETCSPEAADKSAHSLQSRGLGCSLWIWVGGWAACFNEHLQGDSEDRRSSTTNYSAAQSLEPLLGFGETQLPLLWGQGVSLHLALPQCVGATGALGAGSFVLSCHRKMKNPSLKKNSSKRAIFPETFSPTELKDIAHAGTLWWKAIFWWKVIFWWKHPDNFHSRDECRTPATCPALEGQHPTPPWAQAAALALTTHSHGDCNSLLLPLTPGSGWTCSQPARNISLCSWTKMIQITAQPVLKAGWLWSLFFKVFNSFWF